MSSTRILAISSSRVGNSSYLETSISLINNFLGNAALNIAFIPFASVETNHDPYTLVVREGLQTLPYTINTALPDNAKSVIEQSDAIMIGGGNTFKLLHDIYAQDIFDLIVSKVNNGTPYIGWSAGANLTGLSIGTTNDMPIIEPKTFKAFGFFPFQINPHYTSTTPEGHNGETRDQRLTEFVIMNPSIPIVGLPEGSALLLQDGKLTLAGEFPCVVFGVEPTDDTISRKDIEIDTDLTFLMGSNV